MTDEHLNLMCVVIPGQLNIIDFMIVLVSRLVSVVVKVMGDVFPELKQHETNIRDTIAAEEASFGKTLLKVIIISLACMMCLLLYVIVF